MNKRSSNFPAFSQPAVPSIADHCNRSKGHGQEVDFSLTTLQGPAIILSWTLKFGCITRRKTVLLPETRGSLQTA